MATIDGAVEITAGYITPVWMVMSENVRTFFIISMSTGAPEERLACILYGTIQAFKYHPTLSVQRS